MEWEYKVVELPGSDGGRVEVHEVRLNEIGQQGWELIGIFPDEPIYVSGPKRWFSLGLALPRIRWASYRAYLKRQRQ